MPDLTKEPWRQLVPLIPVADHVVRVEAAFWQRLLQKNGLEGQHEHIFEGAPFVLLSRERLLTFEYPEPQQKCLEVLLWGYSSGMRGQYHLHFLQNLDNIAGAARVNAPWPQYFDGLNAIHGLGLSTITKLAYFFHRTFEECAALILDEKITKLLAAGQWQPLHLPGIDYGNAPQLYLDYLRQVNAVSEEINSSPDQIEFVLFSWGESFC